MMGEALYGVLYALRWLDNTTPGTLMAEEIASVSWSPQTGEYRIPVCAERTVGTAVTDVMGAAPTDVCRDTVLTNAEGYAAHIDGSLRVLQTLWVVFGLFFVLGAFALGCRPFTYRPYRPGVKLAATPVTVEKSKKDGRHE